MATDVERLIVRLEATQRQFERQMQGANRTAHRHAREIETRFQRMNRNLSASTAMTANAVQRMFGVIGVSVGGAALIRQVRGAISEMSNLVKTIDRVGLSAKVFQELQFGFELAGVGASEFERGMEGFTQRIGEASMGTGRLLKILEANGVALRDQAGNLRSNESLLRDYANLIRNAASEQEQMTLAAIAFGDRAGRRFVNALKNGADGFDEMAEAAREAGGTIDEELLKRAEKIDDEFAKMWRRFEINGKRAIVTILPELQALDAQLRELMQLHPAVQLWNRIFGDTDQAIANINEVEAEIARLERQIELLQAQIENQTELGFDTSEAEFLLLSFQRQLSQVQQQAQQLRQELARPFTVGTPGDPNALAVQAAGAMRRALPRRRTVLVAEDDDKPSGGRAGSRNRTADAAIREAEAVAKVIESLQTELAELGLSNQAKRVNAELRRAGAGLTEEQAIQIENLVLQIEREKAALEAAAEAAEFLGDMLEDAFLDAIPAINTGNKALDNLLNTLIKVVAQAAILGRGPLAGLFGGGGGLLSIFGFAKGGIAAHGRPLPTFARGGVSRSAAIFGEAGPEAAVPLPDGRRIPVDLRIPKNLHSAEPRELLVRVIGEEGPFFRPAVKAEAEGSAMRVSQVGFEQYDRNQRRGGIASNQTSFQMLKRR